MRKRRKWLLVLAVVLTAGLGYTTYSLFAHTGTDYLTVSDSKSQAAFLYGQSVRVEGKVASGSIEWDNKSKIMRFTLIDDRESLDVAYEGVVPDSFKPGAELIVEGRYRTDGVLEATSFGSRRSVCNLCH